MRFRRSSIGRDASFEGYLSGSRNTTAPMVNLHRGRVVRPGRSGECTVVHRYTSMSEQSG
jgi:hypothetical protein